MPRESFIVAVSGQPTKNLGATVVNAGNTPNFGDSTNNNAGFGVLTGSNTGKSSGSKVVEREGIPQASGQLQAGPGVQSAVFTDPFAGSPLGQVIGKSFSWKDQYTGRLPVRFNHVQSKYPNIANEDTYSKKTISRGTQSCVYRDDGALYGSNVSLTMGSAGMVCAVGAPSGQNATRGTVAPYWPHRRNEGFVEVQEFNKPKTLTLGDISKDGFLVKDPNDDWFSCGYAGKSLCTQSGPLEFKGQALRYSDLGSDRLSGYPKHGITASGTAFGHAVTFNSGGTRMAVGAPYADGERGEVTVYEFTSGSGTKGEWIRVGAPITGNGLPNDRFGWDVALDGPGDIVFCGAPRPGGTGYVAKFELQGTYPGGATWKRDNHGGSVSGVAPRDKFGYSISTNTEATILAVGAPNASGTRGTAECFHRTGVGGTVSYPWKALTRGATGDVQRVVGTASGEMLGWSVSLMYNSKAALDAGRFNPMMAVGSPFYSKSVAEYDFSRRTFAERAAGVPIYDGDPVIGGAGPEAAEQQSLRIGYAYDKVGLTCEGRVTVWQFNKVPAHRKHGYTTLEWLPKGKYSARKMMVGQYPQSEMGYSVALSKTGDYLAVGCPGTDGTFDVSDCEQLTAMTKADFEGGVTSLVAADPTAEHEKYKYNYVYRPDSRSEECYKKDGFYLHKAEGIGGGEVAPGFFKAASLRSKYGIGSVKTFRYVWEGEAGDAARREHYLGSDREDVWIKYGPTIPGTESPVYDYTYRGPEHGRRYARPNFQDLQGLVKMPKHSHHERFGTDVSIIDVISPVVAVGAPFAQDRRYNSEFVREGEDIQRGKYTVTGRVDIYAATPTRLRDNVMPFGGGASAPAGGPLSSRTKTKFEYDAAGSVVASSGGGREAYFIAPNVSGSGLADDNALKTSRKTFGTGGINFTSSD